MIPLVRLARSVMLAALTGCASGAPQPETQRSVVSDQAALGQLQDEWAAAYVRHDAAALAPILAEDFVMSRGRPDVWTKSEYLAHVRADTLRHASITREDERIRIYGDAAVVTYRPTRLTEGRTWTFRSTDTFIRRAGRWQLVARHISEVR